MGTFAAPAPPGAGIPWEDLNGSLLLIEVISTETDIKTAFGLSDAVRANVAVLDGDHKTDTYPNTLVFPKVLRSQLAAQVGKKVLGRLGQGQAKPGQNPPWMLSEATPEDHVTGEKYLAWKQTQDTSAPAVSEPEPVPAGKDVPF